MHLWVILYNLFTQILGGKPDFFLLSTWFTKDAAVAGVTDTDLERLGRMFQSDIGPTFSLKLTKVDKDQYIGWELLIGPAQ
jgi:hypothetical protein